MKSIIFLGKSIEAICDFPEAAKRGAGYQLDKVQHGFNPDDWKPMKTIGAGVREIRVQHEGQYRVIYVAKFKEAVYVLHAFQKKTQKTAQSDIDTAKRALKLI